MIFAVSTYLYRQRRLVSDYLLEIAAHGYTAVELFASRLHVDYHNPSVVADVQQWLSAAGLELTSVHAPVLEMSLASADAAEREAAVAETEGALHVGRRTMVWQTTIRDAEARRVAVVTQTQLVLPREPRPT